MPSTFTWLDFSEGERRHALEVIDQFRDEDTRDELGLSTIRDALSDALFPGVSTIQTRARYFFFVPWMYLEVEKRRVGSSRAAKEGRKLEIALIQPLIDAGESDKGIIGERAQGKLQRLPSNVYWGGLRTWGILQFERSQEEYHRWLDSYYRRIGQTAQSDDGSDGEGLGSANWHPHLPKPPHSFPMEACFELTAEEADYLSDRIRQRTSGSLLAYLVSQQTVTDSSAPPWAQPVCAALPADLRRLVDHARYFSELMHGAALLYNLLLAESLEKFTDHQQRYQERLVDWFTQVSSSDFQPLMTRRGDFWMFIDGAASQPIPAPTKSFVNQWHDLTSGAGSASDITSEAARQLVREREKRLKRGRARIGNPRLLQDWQGKSGAAALNYRWLSASRIINDIVEPLKR